MVEPRAGSRKRRGESRAARDEYAAQGYWERRHGAAARRREEEDAEEGETREWTFSYAELAPILDELRPARAQSTVVDLGCGLSTLLLDMRRAGWPGTLLGTDFAASAVQAQRARAHEQGLELEFEALDLAQLSRRFLARSVDLFVDKLTMDAILHDRTGGEKLARSVARDVGLALRNGGAWLLVTQMHHDRDQDFFHRGLLAALAEAGDSHWAVTAHEADSDEFCGIQVYCFRKHPRHAMRLRRPQRGAVATLTVLSHGQAA
jgi:SAM-dependent methyltransferase